MQNRNFNQIYTRLVSFCEDIGLIKKLSNSLKLSESERFSSMNIEKKGLGVLDAVHCLVDKNRTTILMREIDRMVKDEDVVVEAGVGTGILSFAASTKSHTVYGFEINKNVYDLAINIKNKLLKRKLIKDNVSLIKGDIKSINLPVKIDVIISENLYTGMFFEKQIQIISSLMKSLKKTGIIIPCGMKSTFFLCNTNQAEFRKKNILYIVSEMNLKPTYLSHGYIYDSIDFRKTKAKEIDYKKTVNISKSGNINSVLICSDVLLPSGDIISRFDTEFMNNDIVIKLNKTVQVKSGEKIIVNISYKYGSDPKKAVITLKKV